MHESPYVYINIFLVSCYVYYKLRDVKLLVTMIAFAFIILSRSLLHSATDLLPEWIQLIKLTTVIILIILFGMFMSTMMKIAKDDKKAINEELFFLFERTKENYIFWGILILINISFTVWRVN